MGWSENRVPLNSLGYHFRSRSPFKEHAINFGIPPILLVNYPIRSYHILNIPTIPPLLLVHILPTTLWYRVNNIEA